MMEELKDILRLQFVIEPDRLDDLEERFPDEISMLEEGLTTALETALAIAIPLLEEIGEWR